MEKYKVTIIVRSDQDPSGILDMFQEAVEEVFDGSVFLDDDAVDDGEAVTVEEL